MDTRRCGAYVRERMDPRSHAGRLLGPDDAPPFEVTNPEGRSSFLLICDHAGRLLPRSLGSLGLTPDELATHIAWDIGAGAVARRLAGALDACLVTQRYSRLVIDCNRPLTAADSITALSERTAVPGNVAVAQDAAEARAREIFQPYHDEIGRLLAARERERRPTVLVALHSFTPLFLGQARPWDVGVLYDRDARLAEPLLRGLRAEGDLVVGDNEPYAASEPSDFSIVHHGERRGIPHVEVELRQDLLLEDAGQEQWARRLARLLPAAAQLLRPAINEAH